MFLFLHEKHTLWVLIRSASPLMFIFGFVEIPSMDLMLMLDLYTELVFRFSAHHLMQFFVVVFFFFFLYQASWWYFQWDFNFHREQNFSYEKYTTGHQFICIKKRCLMYTPYLGRNLRKRVVGMCGQRRPRSACADAQSDQGLRCPQTELLGTIECLNGQQTSLCACAGWCGFAHARRHFFALLAHHFMLYT